jgi:hypothetical protein
MATTAVGKNVTLEDVILHVKELEERIAALERLAGQPAPEPAPAPVQVTVVAPPSQFTFSGGTFAVIAKALLGFAGAYLLRAVAESGVIPPGIGIAAGVAYAVFWLVWSTRLATGNRFGGALYALTATSIFAGLVWENAIPAPLIALFAYAGFALAWRKSLSDIAAIAGAGCASLALVLLVTTHNVIPYAAVLLAIAGACEFAATRDRWLKLRLFPALAADLGVLIVAWVITRPQGLPESYPAFSMSSVAALQIALVMIYVTALGYRTLVRGADITNFEIAQNTAAIGLFIWGSVVMGHEAPAARHVVEAFCLLAGLACYATAVLFLAHQSRQRNFLMYGVFGLALVMAGISILFSGSLLVFVWCLLAAIASWLGTHEHRISLQLHAPVFLAAAAVGSGLVDFARLALHGASAPSGSRLIEIVAVTAALALSYYMAGVGETGKARIPALTIAAMLCWGVLGLAGAGITWTLGPDSTISSTLRTGLICALALALARFGKRRPELTWLLYPLMVYGAYRLAVEDFPHGRPTALALSLLFYGGTLLQLTRTL